MKDIVNRLYNPQEFKRSFIKSIPSKYKQNFPKQTN